MSFLNIGPPSGGPVSQLANQAVANPFVNRFDPNARTKSNTAPDFSNERYGIPDAATAYQMNLNNYQATHQPGSVLPVMPVSTSIFSPSLGPIAAPASPFGPTPFAMQQPGQILTGLPGGVSTAAPFSREFSPFGIQQPQFGSIGFSADPGLTAMYGSALQTAPVNVFGSNSRFAQALMAAALTKQDLDNREMVALEIHHRRLNRVEDVVDALASEVSNVVSDHEMRLRKVEGFLSDQIARMATGMDNALSER
mmetsp:Transcript_4298/g.10491  ORF Transcript_4298/g.10491 Transcript_4298/m.10491 type:complete len:253 (+) Transcript_4298:199-957(+)|eukprot:g13361.t1